MGLVSYPQAVFLAIVQGLTEFLPVSSSGHLVIFQKMFGLEPPVLFDVLVHVGTLGALVFYLRRQLMTIFDGLKGRDKNSWHLLLMIVVGTIPAAIGGLLLESHITQIFNSLRLVGLTLLVTAGLLFFSRQLRSMNRRLKRMDWQDALFVGVFQALAILPGVSRSGSTIVAGLWRKLDREAAFQFSFLLAIPAILGALILQTPALAFSLGDSLTLGLLGMLVAGVVGYFALGVLERVLKSAKLFYFGIYCLILGLLVLLV